MHRIKAFIIALACMAVALQLIGTASYREALAQGRQPTRKTGTIQVTRGPADRVVPPDGDGYRYGHGFVFQAAPRLAGMLCNLRTEGFPVGDFEAGMDMIVFERLSDIPTAEAIPLTRNEPYVAEKTGERRIVIKYCTKGGFVPRGALRPDGSPHPHAGTGFVIGEALDFPLKREGYYDKAEKNRGMIRKTEINHFALDGSRLRVVKTEARSPSGPLRAPASEWAIFAPGMRMAIPDGDDLLFAVQATKGDVSDYHCEPAAAGITRWRRLNGLWRPVSFVPVAFNRPAEKPVIVQGREMSLAVAEGTLVRDTDGSLLFSVRSAYSEFENHVIRVWRSTDTGKSWKLAFEIPKIRGQAPVTLNRATDGTPYLVGNLLGHERDWLVLWPLNNKRTGLLEPVTVRNALKDFGPPPSGKIWWVDHANAGVVRLADGGWRNLLSYRIMDRGEHSGKAPPRETGCYVEEVVSAGTPAAAWRFE